MKKNNKYLNINPILQLFIISIIIFLFLFISCQNNSSQGEKGKWDEFALIVIDMQESFMTDVIKQSYPLFAANFANLLNFARSEKIDIIHLRARFKEDMSDWPAIYKITGSIPCIEGTEGEKVLPYAKEIKGEPIFYKNSFDGFLNTGLTEYLKKHNKKQLLVAGLATSICVLATSFSAFQRSFLVTLIEDCTADDPFSHALIINKYSDFIFDTISFKEIPILYSQWMNRLRQISDIEEFSK